MEPHTHTFGQLFAQLGLASDAEAIETFIAQHAPLAADQSLADAPCWTPAQAAFLREGLHSDADWAELIDELNLRLHARAAAKSR